MMRKSSNLLLHPKPSSIISNLFSFLHQIHTHTSSSSSSQLTPDELKNINLLLPRLCQSNHLHEAIRLLDTALLTNPPLHTLSLPVLIDRLSSSSPDMTHSMSLLNRLNHNPIIPSPNPHLLPIARMLITSYFKKTRPKEALKLFNWVLRRADSPLNAPDALMYGLVVKGLCTNFMTLEALMVVKGMLEQQQQCSEAVVYDSEVGHCVFRSLLRLAKIEEAQEFNRIFLDKDEALGRFLDRIIANWTH